MAHATQKDKSHYLPGQTKELDENASDGQALKIFYTTLYKEKPQSELAAKWLLQHGLHDDKETAAKLAKRFGAKCNGDTKPRPPPKRKASDDDFAPSKPKPPPAKKPALKRIAPEPDSSEDDFEPAKAKKPPAAPPKPKSTVAPPPKLPPKPTPPKPKPKLPVPSLGDSSDEDVPLAQRVGR